MIQRPTPRPMCSVCNCLPARSNGKSVLGFDLWQNICSRCAKSRYKSKSVKSDRCNRCGFVAEDSCQLCLVNGETVCQNCNSLRLKQQRPRAELTVDATVDIGNIRL